jgi:hypothetical protein
MKQSSGLVAQEFRRLTVDSAYPVGDFFYQMHKALLEAIIRHLRKCRNETKRVGRVEKCEHATSVLRSTEFFVKKHRDGYVENFCKLSQPTGSDSADALFVLLHLLVGYSQRASKSLLRYTELPPSCPHASTDHLIHRNWAFYRHGSMVTRQAVRSPTLSLRHWPFHSISRRSSGNFLGNTDDIV